MPIVPLTVASMPDWTARCETSMTNTNEHGIGGRIMYSDLATISTVLCVSSLRAAMSTFLTARSVNTAAPG